MSQQRFAAEWSDTARLSTERADWARLAAAVIEPNPFYGPDFLIAAALHLHRGRPIRAVILRDRTLNGQLVGLMPLERPFLRDGLLGSAWRLYASPYTCLSAPLIDGSAPAEILAAMLEFLAREPGPKRLILPQMIEDGAIAGLIGQAGRQAAPRIVSQHRRAAIRTTLDLESYRRAHWKKSLRGNLGRRARQLEEIGTLAVRRIAGGDPLAPAALEAFLALEKRGWKGEAGTAMACRPETAAFARAALAESPAALYEILSLDDRPIAINIHLVAQNAAFAFKTAYDPDFARFGPGILLDAAALELVTKGGALARIDSCAGPGHPIENLWGERESVQQWAIGLHAAPRGRQSLDLALLGRWIALVERLRAARHASTYTTRPRTG